MDNVYLDTNFFLYLSDKSSPFYLSCNKFLKQCDKEKTIIYTSAETIQEIIHYSKNIKQLRKGLKAANKALSLVDSLFAVNKTTIDIYLKYAVIYQNAGSRDLIHLAVCLENKIDKIVTFDKDFGKFKEIQILNPQENKN